MVWLEIPSSADYPASYPEAARGTGIVVRVVLDCIVEADYRIACAAADDGFPEYDFEQAALLLATRFRSASRTRPPNGVETIGKRVRTSVVVAETREAARSR